MNDERDQATSGGAGVMPWRSFLARLGVGGIVGTLAVFVGVRFATADPSGPPTRSAMTFSGVLRTTSGVNANGPVMLTFAFQKGTPVTATCTPPPVTANCADGAFTAPVPIDTCPTGFFDGTDITYTVSDGASPPLTPAPVHITPVPYARFSDRASTALRAEAASGTLLSQLNAASHTRTRSGEEIRPQLDLPISATELGGEGHTILLSVTVVGASLDIKRLYVVYISSSTNFGACFSELGTGARFSPGSEVSVLNPILDAAAMTPTRVACNSIFLMGRRDDALAGVVVRFERMPSSGWRWQYSTHVLN